MEAEAARQRETEVQTTAIVFAGYATLCTFFHVAVSCPIRLHPSTIVASIICSSRRRIVVHPSYLCLVAGASCLPPGSQCARGDSWRNFLAQCLPANRLLTNLPLHVHDDGTRR